MGILNSSINTLSFNGDLNFKSNSLGNIINTNGIELQSNIYFNGGGGSWILSSDITTSKDIYLSGGLFNSNSKEVNASVFYSP